MGLSIFERDAVLLFALRPENGHAVGEFVAAGDLLSPQLICDDGLAIADYCTGLGTGML